MKKAIFALALFGALFFTAGSVSAKGIIFYSNGEKVEVFKTLPDDAVIDGAHVNLGVRYSQFSIFWIPVWNYGETKYVLINDKKDTYWDLDAETVETLKTDFNVDIPEKPAIGFWNRIGGKIVWGIAILIAIAGWRTTRKEDEEPEIPSQNS
jgi:hypothetical protein